jgi:hypothetical protein
LVVFVPLHVDCADSSILFLYQFFENDEVVPHFRPRSLSSYAFQFITQPAIRLCQYWGIQNFIIWTTN